MMKQTPKSQSGFTLLELIVASSIGLTVILTMATLFKTGMDTSMKVTQRAETQQNLRAAVELMTKDISLAGAGLPSGGVQLGTAGVSKIACNQGGTCYLTGGTYPNSSSGSANYMYAIEPGFGTGVESGASITAAPSATNSSITVVYCDYNFPLEPGNFTFNPSSTTASVSLVASPTAGEPTNILAPGGLNVGDLLLFQVQTPGNGAAGNSAGNNLVANPGGTVVAEITGLPATTATPPVTVDFATGDPLNFNFTTGSNNMASVASAASGSTTCTGTTCPQVSVCRLEVVTYFLQVPTAVVGLSQTPRLMRQVNGLTAVPVADNIINLQFTYDVINSATSSVVANVQNPIGSGYSPSLIQKVNLWVMGQSLVNDGKRAQSMYLATAISTRNMSFCNAYSNATTQCQ
jgi:prepilin-type N-terminal cleavage/methylation domain-containing protein